MSSDEIFDSALNLEQRLYCDGFDTGIKDGRKIGHLEGRTFGFERGFGDYSKLGRLHGRAVIWSAHSKDQSLKTEKSFDIQSKPSQAQLTEQGIGVTKNGNDRLQTNLMALLAYSTLDESSAHNDEATVEKFDFRLKRAEGKARIVEKLLANPNRSASILHTKDSVRNFSSATQQSIEAIDLTSARH